MLELSLSFEKFIDASNILPVIINLNEEFDEHDLSSISSDD